MSLETMLDEERREVLALLEGNPSARSGAPAISESSAGRLPVRSMLDVDAEPTHTAASIAGLNGRAIAPQTPTSVRSMLDVSGSPRRPASSGSPVIPKEANSLAHISNHQPHHRGLSDASVPPATSGPRTAKRTNPEKDFQFSGFLPSNPGGPVVPKRNTQAGRLSTKAPGLKKIDLSNFTLPPGDRSRNRSVPNSPLPLWQSKSSNSPLGQQSRSPSNSQTPSTLTLRDGTVLEMSGAYRRLSDANIRRAGGSLSTLPAITRSQVNGGGDGDASSPRLHKDYVPIDGVAAPEDSSDESARSSDDESHRGRKKTGNGAGDKDGGGTTIDSGLAKSFRAPQSLLAAAEQERQEVEAMNTKYKVRSLLDPEITITAPHGDKLKSIKPGIHPNTSFDESASGFNTPVTSDTEAEITDIKRAQKLSMHMTTISSTPATSRCVRTLYRGDFPRMQKEATDNQRRARKYLVATDLSDEAAHALEWTIGTVLRDGDTMLAIYCIDEEAGIAQNASGDDSQTKDQVAATVSSTRNSCPTRVDSPVPTPSPLAQTFRLVANSASASPMGRGKDKAEQERYRAIKDITDSVSRLLRKTKLQVKVVIEVIHCKSPNRLLTEIIDYISPTLVIIGSRGRSALKGVILGSFSNYIVTKSSVPVMVARKRLRKHTKYKRPQIKLANNLSNPAIKSLATANAD